MRSNIKSLFFAGMLASLAVVGCGDTTDEHADDHNDTTTTAGTNVDRDDDADFLSDAVEANTLELRALTLGEQKGSSEVKSHASHMIADHKQLGEQVAAYISSKGLTLEDVDTNDRDNDLNEKAAGKEFDKAWADKMVSDHEKVINMFEDAQDDVNDPELKTMITNAIPKLKSHLDMSKQLQEKLSK